MSVFEPHRLVWTPEHVRRFWDQYSTNPANEDIYFARAVGDSLINYVERRIPIGCALDIGCGRGDFIEFLIKHGYPAYGVDQSKASVEQVNRRFEGRTGFKGAAVAIDLPEESIDTAFLIEVVEHLDDDALKKALTDAARLVRRGGYLVITTPNEENLRDQERMCPECGSIFHAVQHVRSWSVASLSSCLRTFGFQSVSTQATVLSPYKGPLAIAYRLAYRAIRKRNPHLIYIGQRL